MIAQHARRVLIDTKQKMAAALRLVENMPVDEKSPWEVVIRLASMKRRDRQNAYYWMRLGEISKQAWVCGKTFSAEAWHEEFKATLMPEVVKLKNGEMASKWIETPSRKFIRSTTDLAIDSFAEYTNIVEAFGAGDLGVQFSAELEVGR